MPAAVLRLRPAERAVELDQFIRLFIELCRFQAIMRRIGSRPTLFLILGFSDPAASGTGRKKIPEALMSRREKSTQ